MVRAILLGVDGLIDAGQLPPDHKLTTAIAVLACTIATHPDAAARADMMRCALEALPGAVERYVASGDGERADTRH